MVFFIFFVIEFVIGFKGVCKCKCLFLLYTRNGLDLNVRSEA